MRIPDREKSTLRFDWQIERDAGGQVANVHVAADPPRRHDGMQSGLSRSDADRSGKRLQWYAAARTESRRRHGDAVVLPDMQSRFLELIGQQAETRNIRCPAMTDRVKLADGHFQGVAGFGALHIDRPGHRVDLAEIQIGQGFQGRIGAELSAGGIQAFEQDGLTGLCRQRRWKILVPAEIMLCAMNRVGAGDAHESLRGQNR